MADYIYDEILYPFLKNNSISSPDYYFKIDSSKSLSLCIPPAVYFSKTKNIHLVDGNLDGGLPYLSTEKIEAYKECDPWLRSQNVDNYLSENSIESLNFFDSKYVVCGSGETVLLKTSEEYEAASVIIKRNPSDINKFDFFMTYVYRNNDPYSTAHRFKYSFTPKSPLIRIVLQGSGGGSNGDHDTHGGEGGGSGGIFFGLLDLFRLGLDVAYYIYLGRPGSGEKHISATAGELSSVLLVDLGYSVFNPIWKDSIPKIVPSYTAWNAGAVYTSLVEVGGGGGGQDGSGGQGGTVTVNTDSHFLNKYVYTIRSDGGSNGGSAGNSGGIYERPIFYTTNLNNRSDYYMESYKFNQPLGGDWLNQPVKHYGGSGGPVGQGTSGGGAASALYNGASGGTYHDDGKDGAWGAGASGGSWFFGPIDQSGARGGSGALIITGE